MTTAQALLAEYSESHQNRTNKLIHWFAVPAIYWSVFVLLWSLPKPSGFPAGLNWGVISLIAAQLYYFWLSWRLGISMLAGNALVWGATIALAAIVITPVWEIGLTVFVVAWVAQFIGHKIEGKKPAFFTDVFFLLIGPAWCASFVLRKIGLKV